MQKLFSGARMSARAQAAVLFGVLSVFFIAGIYIGASEPRTHAASTSTLSFFGSSQPADVDFNQFWLTWQILGSRFIETHASSTIPTDQEKVYGAISGLVHSYGDPYTEFFPPAEATVFQENISGSFGGVGMELGSRDGDIVVIAPLKDSPAERAGLKAGDIIAAVDNTPMLGLTVGDAVKLIRGEIGTPVKITVVRSGASEPIVISVVRDTIHIPTLNWSDDKGNGIFTIELYNFDAVSADKFREALRAYFASGETKLLLDLRGNPGGYLEAAVEMASYFLPVGELVVAEDYRSNRDQMAHRSYGYNVFANRKLTMAILVNQGSASAAEILAGALQQHGVATLIGTRTFGKGSVQEWIDLGGGAALKVTVARWLTPNGTSISDGGLTPDLAVEISAKDADAGIDTQKESAKLWLTNN